MPLAAGDVYFYDPYTPRFEQMVSGTYAIGGNNYTHKLNATFTTMNEGTIQFKTSASGTLNATRS